MNGTANIVGARDRAPYACDPAKSRGRLVEEPESLHRSPFQRDRDRIVHAAAFRRLKHKTQVFVYHEGDYYRTRLTHSLEVAQIARSFARVLRVDEDLAEALALAHDLGHPPFGHAGEDALNAAMRPHGGFDHNGHTLRILTRLEERYAAFDGLNLTWETLEGVAKHNGPLIGAGRREEDLPWSVAEYAQIQDLELDSYPSAEAQIAALSDDIAYHAHDIDDGLRARLFEVADLADVPLIGPIFAEVEAKHPGLQRSRLIHEAVRRLIDGMVRDALAETQRRLDDAKPRAAADIRALGRPIVGFSPEMQDANDGLRKFLYQRMYRHYRVNRMTSKARRVVTDLCAKLMEEPDCLPPDWQARAGAPGSTATARTVSDYIAGMTDRYALSVHHRLFHLYDEE